MSSDIVKRLNTWGDGLPNGILLMREAADRIEALEGEKQGWVEAEAQYLADVAVLVARAERLEGEVERLASALEGADQDVQERLLKAEARAERLHVALSDALSWISGCVVSGQYPGWVATARKVIEDEKPIRAAAGGDK